MGSARYGWRASVGIVVAIYALALAVGYVVLLQTAGWGLLWAALAADVAATVVVFAGSRALDNSSVYDPYWSVAPLPLALWWLAEVGAAGEAGRQALVIGALGLWGARLTWNFLRGWTGLGHEDWRYVEIRKKTGGAYWIVSFLGIHLMPTLLVFGGSVSAYVAIAGRGRALGWLDAVAAVVTFGAIAIEATADAQLRRFVLARTDLSKTLETGLWRWSRHPNYFGEMVLWLGIAVIASEALAGRQLVALISPVFVFVLIRYISGVPMLEAKGKKRFGNDPRYQQYVANTPVLVLRPPKKAD